MSRRNRDKRKAKQVSHSQIAYGSLIAQASNHSSASVNIYNDSVKPHTIDTAAIEAAIHKLRNMPLNASPGASSLSLGSRPPAYAPNPLFVGRENELRTIAALLREPVRATVVITAMGGMGKTQLATEFVRRYSSYFAGGVFWLNFADPAAIPMEIAACCTAMQQELRSDVHTFPPDLQSKQICAAWQSDLPRLLIFDTCEDESLLALWRPPVGGCRILVTSRRGEIWSKELGVTTLPLHELPRPESIALLTKHRPDLSPSSLDPIAQEVGDLPLALHLAGSYLEMYSSTPDAYLAALRKTTPLDHLSFNEEGTTYDTGHIRHLTRTFAVSYEQLNARDPIDQSALTLLACIAHFAPGEPIPSDLLRAAVMIMKGETENADQSADTLALALLENAEQLEDMSLRALQRLITLGLLEKYPETTYRMHRLLHSFVCRQEVADNPQVQMIVESVTLVLAHELNQTRDFWKVRLLLPHLRAITQQSPSREDGRGISLSLQLAAALHQTGAYQEAERLYKEALAMGERVLGDPNKATVINNLAELYREQGRYPEAEPLMQEALTIRERILGREHPETALSLNSLAGFYQAQGKYKEAELLCREALKVTEQVLGRESPETATMLNNLGFLCGVQGKSKEAEALFKRSLAIRERVLGKEHTDTARTVLNLAMLYTEQGRYPEAEPLVREALEIWKRVLGKEHPDTARALDNLAVLFLKQGRYEKAEPLIQEALTIREQILGKEHPETAQSLYNLASLYLNLGRYKEAEPLYREALSVYRQKLGEGHPDTILLERNYALLPAKIRQQ